MELGTSQMAAQDKCSPTSRPTVPPKPKPNEKEVGRPSTTKNTIGTQVNSVRKSLQGERGKPDIHSSSTKRNGTGTAGQEGLSASSVDVIEVLQGNNAVLGSDRSRSLSTSAIKPALPPKPAPNAILSPRRVPNPTSPNPDSKNKSPFATALISSGHPITTRPSNPSPDLNNLNVQNHAAFNPVSNLNQILSSNRLTQGRTVQPLFSPLTESQKSEARKKTTSLGRNFEFSTISAGRNSFQHIAPLDLSSSISSRPRSMDQFGRTIISFATNSPLPPPPPPRIKRKFSSIAPSTAVLPETPPTSPPPVYAKVDKDKKWEMRRLKKEQEDLESNSKLEVLTNETQTNAKVLVDPTEDSSNVNSSQVELRELETPVISSWLGKVLEKAEDSDKASAKDNSELISREQIQNIIGRCLKPEEAVIEDEELTPRVEELPENSSFLFLHIVKDQVQTVASQIDSPLSPPPDPTEESFEHLCESRLEPIIPSVEVNGNVTVVDSEINDLEKAINANQDTLGSGILDLSVDAGKLLESVDSKIQSLQSLLSTITNGSDTFTETIPLSEESLNVHKKISRENHSRSGQQKIHSEDSSTGLDFTNNMDKTDADLVSDIVSQKFNRKEESAIKSDKVKPLPVLLNRDSFRRRSWNCSENTSSPTSGSSPSSSSSSIRDRAGSLHATGWLDAGDSSTGGLGDTENSDVSTHINPGSLRPYPGSGGSLSRRKRTTMQSIFSSFGKGMGSSSGSNSPNGKSKRKEKNKTTESKQPKSPHMKAHPQRALSNAIVGATSSQLSHWPGGSPQELNPPPKKTVSMPHFSNPTNDDLYPAKRGVSPNPSVTTLSSMSSTGNYSRDTTTVDEDSVESTATARRVSAYDDILADLLPKEKKAFYVARELLTSERTFVDVLNLLTIDFPQALKEAAELNNRQPVISNGDLQTILGALPTLKEVNIFLLNELEDRICGWKSNPKVADIIVKNGPFLKHYSTYIKDFEKMSNFFGECRQRNTKFSKAVMDFESSDRCQKLCLNHYMLKPVQRMPLYPLLLEDYLKNLEEDSPDYQDTLKAITIVREVADHANEAIRLQVNADKLIQLQNRLHHSVILKPDRQLIREGELQKVCRKELQPRYFALMNDCLLCMMYNASTGSNKDLKLRYELPLTGMHISLSSSEDYPNEFTVISTTRSFNLLARSPKEREEWMKALTLAIKENIKKRAPGRYRECSTPDIDTEFELGKVAPVWVADLRVTMCQVCTAEFTLIFRRHHCRCCGKVVCGHCSRNEAPLHYQQMEAARVCDDCYQFLLEEFDRENQQNHSFEIERIRARFKKATLKVARAPRRCIPTRLEINSSVDSQVSGYLNWRERKTWKRKWFVLADRVLLVCAASEDVVASQSIPILGYDVEVGTAKIYEGVDGQLVFKLTHSGQSPMIFQAENHAQLEKWVGAMREATVLT